MIANSPPASWISTALTSPVKAPSRSQCRFCAPMPMSLPRAASLAACSAVNGGATITSTLRIDFISARSSLM